LKQGIVLLAHGSRDPQWATPFERIAACLAEKLPAVSIGLAFLDNGPSLDETVSALVAKGVGSIRVVPLFLGRGGHVKEDLPALVQHARRSGVQVLLEKPIGEDPRVIEAIAGAISAGR
jgi:sirohydrochlorin cobaltochelatase